jgi:ABC-2 type transport system permease protein
MSAQLAVKLRRFPTSSLTLMRFVGVRTLKSASIWGVVFGLYMYASAEGYLNIAPTPAARARIVSSLADNIGLKALFGEPHNVATVAGFVDWRNLGIVALVGAIWGLLTATKAFRSEEDSGRWELFMAGKTTGARAALQALAGLYIGLVGMFLLTFLITVAVGKSGAIGFTVLHSALFAATSVANAAIFLAFGACASQVMPIRSRAVSLSVLALGMAFLLRAAADVAGSVHWLIYISPLGWTELVHPLSTDVHPVWLVPSALSVVVLSGMTIILARHRDLGSSVVADRNTARPHLLLLGNAFLADIRFTKDTALAWVAAIGAFGIFFGSLAKTAGQAFSSSDIVARLGSDIEHQAQVTGSRLFIGFIFFMIMTLVMLYVASAFSGVRETEAEGYGDNFFVRSVGRITWLGGRTILICTVAAIACALASMSLWAAASVQHTGLGVGELVRAGANAMAPAVLLIGMGVCIVGFLPRITSAVLYGYVAWSFLLQLVGTVLHINHWLLDSSVLFHVTLAPSVPPNWTVAGICMLLGAVLATLGLWRFKYRDLMAN